jgi:hypothetical protein
LTQSLGINFARQKCDRRAMQSLMREDAFALQIGNTERGSVAG